MGRQLVRNIAHHGIPVVVHNRTAVRTGQRDRGAGVKSPFRSDQTGHTAADLWTGEPVGYRSEGGQRLGQEVHMGTQARGSGPVTAKLADRSPFGAIEPLDHEALVTAQKKSAAAPRRSYSLSARVLFVVMDALYGKERTLPKFRVLELVARVPY